MLTVVIVPEAGFDASRLLRNKVTHEARTWYWKNRTGGRRGWRIDRTKVATSRSAVLRVFLWPRFGRTAKTISSS